MDNTTGFILEGGGPALLLLHDFGDAPEDMRPLAGMLRQRGFTVSAPALFDPDADWTRWLRTARLAFSALCNTHVCVSVCGFGAGMGMALLLAGEYAPEHLLLMPARARSMPFSIRFGLRALDRRARRSLFAVSARPCILVPTDADAVILRQARRLSRALGRCLLSAYIPEDLAQAVAWQLAPQGASDEASGASV